MAKKPVSRLIQTQSETRGIALIEALATNAALLDDEIVPSLGKLHDGTLLAMFCVIRCWVLDSFARLSGVIRLRLEKKFDELDSRIRKREDSHLSNLAAQTGDGSSLLLLATTLDTLRLIAIAIKKT